MQPRRVVIRILAYVVAAILFLLLVPAAAGLKGPFRDFSQHDIPELRSASHGSVGNS